MEADVQAFVREVWRIRHTVETEASARFAALARRMSEAGAPRVVVSLAERASGDELRHAGHCQTLVSQHGGSRLTVEPKLIEYAPVQLAEDVRLLYEVVAQCCVAETESMGTLMVLLDGARDAELKDILHELARDEVNHSRIGWAYLAWAKSRYDLKGLGRFIPGMLEGNSAGGIFSPPKQVEDGDHLLRYGVVPASMRRAVYVETLESVVFPGLEDAGVDTVPARTWLQDKLAQAGVAA